MIRIGLLSDTHGHVDSHIKRYTEGCDEIWHAGDFGTEKVADALERIKPLTGVYGNVDGRELRARFPLDAIFEKEGVRVYMTHIGGYPGRYDKRVEERIRVVKPQLFICGHSHILKVARDKNHDRMLAVNPGAAGHHGIHSKRTMVRFGLQEGAVTEFEVIELGPRGRER